MEEHVDESSARWGIIESMKKYLLGLVLAAAFCALAVAAKHYPLNASSIVPAAKGNVDIGKDKNGNTEIKLKVEHLAKPDALTPPQSRYVVWLQEKTSPPSNEGELKVNGKLVGTFQTVTPSTNFDLFVTAESDGTVKAPSGPEVLRTSITR